MYCSSEIEKKVKELEEVIQRYEKAERRANIAAFCWGLAIIVQILANLDKILPI